MATLHPRLAALLAVALFAPLARAEEVVNSDAGYALRVPAGWRRVPDEVLKEYVATVVKPGANPAPNFVAAFEPSDHAEHLQHPYAMVQVHSYGPGVSVATISRREVDDLVAKITGMPVSKLKEGFTDEAAGVLGEASVNSPTVRTTPPGFTMGIRMSVAGVPIRGQTYCVLGRTNAAFLHFYAKESEWAKHAGVLEGLAGGFRRTPDQTVTLGTETRTASGKKLGGGIDWSRVWMKAVAGAVIGAIAGGVGWAVKRRSKAGGGAA